ncbi:MAG: ROK family protein [Candidatus Woesearchaeota archaeon]
MPFAIGVDIGGTYIKAGIVDNKGKIYEQAKSLTEAKKGRDRVVENIIDVIKKLFSENIKGIGVGVPGIVHKDEGIIGNTPNLPLHSVALREILKKHFKKKVKLENDANCFGLSEARFGNGKKLNNVLCLTLGTGIGSAMIIKGKLYHGSGNAPELGHTTIHFKGPKCKCGNFGCAEEYVSTRGLLKTAKSYGLKLKDTVDIYLAAERNNRKAIKTFEEYGTLLGVVLSNFMDSYGPDLIVLGGQITGSWRFFHKNMSRELNKRSFISACKVVKTEINNAGVVGAASLVV